MTLFGPLAPPCKSRPQCSVWIAQEVKDNPSRSVNEIQPWDWNGEFPNVPGSKPNNSEEERRPRYSDQT